VTSFKNTRDRRAYTVEEVARLLGVSRGSAYEAVRCGVIRSLTIGRRIVIPPSAVAELLGGEPPRPADLLASAQVDAVGDDPAVDV